MKVKITFPAPVNLFAAIYLTIIK